MIYLTEADIQKLGIEWTVVVDVIERAVHCLAEKDFSQPIKPYLRYRDPKNRIIAMPAFVGGAINTAGIKWIASFPDNIHRGIPRAHSVVVLNKADTGEPFGIVNTALLSIVRTAAVSGLLIRYFEKARKPGKVDLGITGWGPIGRHHLKMCSAMLGDRLNRVFLYDIRGIDPQTVEEPLRDNVTVAENWRQAYENADIFITCTVSDAPYIDRPPKAGSLQLNVSLRDYKTDVYPHVKDAMIVDDWQEVCRQNTDVERFHKEKGLRQEDTRSIADVVTDGGLGDYPASQAVMFNPMGMAVFDIALGRYYIDEALKKGLGQRL